MSKKSIFKYYFYLCVWVIEVMEKDIVKDKLEKDVEKDSYRKRCKDYKL